MSARRRTVVAGLAVTALYAAAAALSGHLSPLARRPLLDGLAPPTAYRWVEPPPELAATNKKPTPGRFEAKLGPNGSRTSVFTTDDAQVTLIMPGASFPPAPGQDSVEITVESLGPSDVRAPDSPLHVVGNVYLLEATYQPSGDEATLNAGITVVLVYPLLANDHGKHTMILSRNGKQWRTITTNDLRSIQQADAVIDELGYVTLAGMPASPTAGGGSSGGSSSVATIVIVAALVVLATVTAFVMRRRSTQGSRTGER